MLDGSLMAVEIDLETQANRKAQPNMIDFAKVPYPGAMVQSLNQ